MAQIYYYLTTIVFTIIVIVKTINTRKILTLYNVIFVSISVNFVLYLFNWSTVFTQPVQDDTYYIIATTQLLFIIYALLCDENKFSIPHMTLKRISFGSFTISIAYILVICCLVFSAIENIYLTGGLFAVDESSHTSTMPVIGPILRGMYPVAYISAVIDYGNYKRKSIVILSLICIAYQIVGTRARFWCLISVLTVFIFMMKYEGLQFRTTSGKVRNFIQNMKLRYKILAVIALVFALNYIIEIGAERINTFTYAEIIGYTGPGGNSGIGNLLSWYYGYFPFSFYNLNTTVEHINKIGFTFGKFLVYPILSVLQIDGIFGISYSGMTYSIRIISNNAATVATGLYECYSDFGMFFFISLIIWLFITVKMASGNKAWMWIVASYLYVVWFFMSFLNVFTVGVPIYVAILAFVFDKIFVIYD